MSADRSLPLILSVFISQDLFPGSELPFSPASTLTIPLINIRTPYNYIPVFVIYILTIFLGKYSAVLSSEGSGCLPLEFGQGYPGLNIFSHRQPLPSLSTAEGSSSQQVSVTTAFDPPGNADQNAISGTPLFPRGLAFNILLSAPLEESETTSTFYAYKLFTIKHLFGVLIAVVTILIYLFLYPRVHTKPTGSEQ